MKILNLTRKSDNGVETLGELIGTGFNCKTLERPWKNNMSGISCIPKGSYLVKWTLSPRLLRFTYEIQNVPGRSGIRIHKGNYFFDVEGCILLGTGYSDINKDGQVDIINSTAMIQFFEKVMNKEPFTLVIL